jgi:DNA-binding response OmpR family regulator
LEYTDTKLYRWGDIMTAQSLMMLEMANDQGIRCRVISEWFKVDSYVPSIEKLLTEIERNMPDVVVMDLDLYERMDGIEISRRIRNRFQVPVLYV